MASTAIKSEEAKKEYFDSPEVLDKKVTQLAQMILESKHFTTFTGAGISTASGIPDYRSGANTVLPTGAGCWETAANIQKARKEGKLYHAPAKKAEFNMKISQAMPSKTHMAMVAMQDAGLLKHIISQNIDGLHRKSGIHGENISELHGNTNLEKCRKCGKDYMRDFKVSNPQIKGHGTGRKCDNGNCKGDLYDSIINFGENLNEYILERGEQMGYASDIMLCMGSSLRVTPACDIPKDMTFLGGKMVICNLQKTPLDSYASLIIHAKCDDMIELLMKKLNMAIPQFKLQRWLKVKLDDIGQGKDKMTVSGIDRNGGPFELFKSIRINGGVRNQVTLKETDND